jgi:hypothetical protein
MHHHGYTIAYFAWNGLKYGLLCGLLGGSLIFPIGGQLIGAPIGAFAGDVIGLLLGITIALYNQLSFSFETDIQRYRRMLTRNAGIGTALLFFAALFVAAFPENLYQFDWTRWFRNEFLLWMCFFVPPALMLGLAMAHITHRYANQYASRMTKQKRDVETLDEDAVLYPVPNVNDFFMSTLFKPVRPLMLLTGIGAALVHIPEAQTHTTTLPALVWDTIVFGAGIGLLVGASMLVVGYLNVALITAANRIYFDEYQPDMPLARYRNRIGWISGLVTLLYSIVITVGVGAPVAAFLAAWTARQYADHRYEAPEKAKNKAKNDATERLQLADHDDDNPFAAEQADAEQVYRQP